MTNTPASPPKAAASPASAATDSVMPAPVPPRAEDSRLTATSLIDEAAHALRRAPLGTLGIYYAGTLPFALGLLYFWSDMARSPDAAERAPVLARGLAVLFLGMKCAQAVFAACLRAQFARDPMPSWTLGRLRRVLLVQAGLHAPGLFVLALPVAVFLLPLPFLINLFIFSVVITPYGWMYTFYQNVTALGGGAPGVTTRQVAHRAWSHALVRSVANHKGLSILFGLAFFVWLNLMAAASFLPQLVQMFTGEENMFTRNPGSLQNTTTLLISGVLAYLAIDPLIKTFYALRCFHADSARTGEDLRAELRALPPVDKAAGVTGVPEKPAAALTTRAGAAILVRMGLLTLALLAPNMPQPARAAPPPPAVNAAPAAPAPAAAPPGAQGPPAVSPPALDRSIRDVLQRREFAWRRAQREAKPVQAEPNSVQRWLSETWKSTMKWLREFFKRSERDEPPAPAPVKDGGAAVGSLVELLVYVVCGLLILGVLYLLWSFWRGRKNGELKGKKLDSIEGKALTPDLSAEDVLATQLPEDEWLALARRLLAEGERRLALRAMYLSLLSALGAKGLLTVARHKSNRDYLNELRRRLRDRPEGTGAFGRNVNAFERVWYGSDPVDDGLLETFQADREVVLG